MNVMKMPVKELMKNETARTEACGWMLFGCGLVISLGSLFQAEHTFFGVCKALGAGALPLVFAAMLLQGVTLQRRIQTLEQENAGLRRNNV